MSDTAQTAQEVHQKIEEWLVAVHAGDLDHVVALYAKEASFHPTMSGKFGQGEDFVRAYHQGTPDHLGFTMQKPDGKLVGEVLQRVSQDQTMVTSSGCYDFTIGDKVSHARFTFVHEKIDGAWVITTHHSSLRPGA